MKRLVLLAFAALLGAALPASAACRIGKMQFGFDHLSYVDLEVGPGEYCVGRFDFPTLKITRIEVPNQPRSGLVRIEQKTFEWKYRPFGPFRGKDMFAIKIFAQDARKASDGVIQFNVTVR